MLHVGAAHSLPDTMSQSQSQELEWARTEVSNLSYESQLLHADHSCRWCGERQLASVVASLAQVHDRLSASLQKAENENAALRERIRDLEGSSTETRRLRSENAKLTQQLAAVAPEREELVRERDASLKKLQNMRKVMRDLLSEQRVTRIPHVHGIVLIGYWFRWVKACQRCMTLETSITRGVTPKAPRPVLQRVPDLLQWRLVLLVRLA